MDISVKFVLTDENKQVIIKSLRECIDKKNIFKPYPLSKAEFDEWFQINPDSYIHDGLMSLWEKIVHTENHPVVIRKKGGRDSDKPFLVFDSNKQYEEYCDFCRKIGVFSYYLVDEWLTAKLTTMAKANNLPEVVVEEIQSAIECNVGLYYELPDENATDEHLFLAVCAYIKKIAPQKAATVFGKYCGMLVYIDGYDFEFFGSDDEEEGPVLIAPDDSYSDNVNYDLLVNDVMKTMTTFLNSKDAGKRYDIKDNLLPVVISSKNSVLKFLEEYYPKIKNRVSVWRPVSLGYQITYSFENGQEYLKNPVFISKCSDTTLGAMILQQGDFSRGKRSVFLAIGDLEKVLAKYRQLDIRFIECAESAEQIGKALSKELRTKETLAALAKSLPIAAAEKNPDISIAFLFEDEVNQNE